MSDAVRTIVSPSGVVFRKPPRPRLRGVLLFFVLPVTIIAVALAATLILGATVFGRQAGQALVQSEQFGAYDASVAAELATQRHIPDGHLTLSLLGSHTSIPWASATTSVLLSGRASVDAKDEHVLVATSGVPPCIYGLVVTSPKDPIIATDQLPAAGTYYSAPTPNLAYGEQDSADCEAAMAPTSGWLRASPATLKALGQEGS